jgi:lipopolysaccharide/colanic/teichoic acid biosynthesis glycosyltransferase
MSGLGKAMKRFVDITGSILGLVLLSPVLLIVWVMVRRDMGSPVLFRQTRPGLNGQPFQMVKFRTMRDATDSSGNPLPDSERLTNFGRFLRSSSLDELPELWNVLRGDMSLVGPRPPSDGVFVTLFSQAGSPPRGSPRCHGLGTDQRAQFSFLGRKIRIRRMVCQQPHLLA